VCRGRAARRLPRAPRVVAEPRAAKPRVRVSRRSRLATALRAGRVSRQSRARRSRVSACRGEAALRPPCGRAQLVIIIIIITFSGIINEHILFFTT